MNFLIVDDDKDIRQILISILSTEVPGTYTEAGSGQEALNYCEKVCFDLIITDLSMPKVNGVELIERLRAKVNNENCNTQIVVVSAFRDLIDKLNGVDGVTIFEKPISFSNLSNFIKKFSKSFQSVA